ncbi:replication-associated recombination protein A [Paludicola sp. MB14-C6]|uniref:replication-associated recombination protein A n=1 Tax=Paludihabitans sp. MB14-C6 TaxID=3070656 RepID=UPI0027DD539C|nr:replication-associated recombination protein A [Paludicola sp. MB14-C6]WMJ22075.1 replication-associated recombination protein A [Paludicola sp. MB14-C6]
MATPLAELIRPKSLDDVVGQPHLLGIGKPLRRIIESGHIPNMIFYGSSGIGKTTVARIIAEKTNMRLHKLNGTSCSTADIKAIVEELDTIVGHNGILLYLDEIQYLNKKQQQSLLEHIENGNITLIASTTENPYFYIYNAILSRSTVFEFKPVTPDEIRKAVTRAFSLLEQQYSQKAIVEENVVEHIAQTCGGDVRKSMNAAELCYLSANINENGEREVTLELAEMLAQKSSMKYDRDGDQHYEILSALQKSVRGSDENAALHYLARLMEAGDLISACRRILVMASEDVGLAYPQAIPIVKACCDMARELGLPEARIPLADAVVLLATAPKSNSAYNGINSAMIDVQKGLAGDIPSHLKNAHYDAETKSLSGAKGYKYPHEFKNHFVKQQYLPNELKDRVYYSFGENKNEQAAKAYRMKIIKE